MLLQITEPDAPELESTKELAIGIDLGTTHSVAGIVENGVVRFFEDHSTPLVPSVVTVDGRVGIDAISSGLPLIHSIKRLMPQIHDARNPSYTIQKAAGGSLSTWVEVDGKTYHPVEISSHILRHLKALAENDLGRPVTKAVITVPAHFDEAARLATKEAASLAGLQVLRLLNEPTAAAVAYGMDEAHGGTVAIYDLGGGTFDISILRLTRGVFQVLATGGDLFLGGDDIDHALATAHFPHLTPDRARQIAKAAKEALSDVDEVTLEGVTLTRAHLDQAVSPLIQRTLAITEQVLVDAHVDVVSIDHIILVGGSSRLRDVQEKIAALFGRVPLVTHNPDLVVAMGAARQAMNLSQGSGPLLLDVCPLSLGLETMGGLVEKMIPRNTPIPAVASQMYTTYQDGQTAISIQVVQGEAALASDCRSLAHFELRGIPTLPAGAARVRVQFMLDADGLLTVTAEELTAGIKQAVDVKPSYGLSDEAVLRILGGTSGA